MLILSRAREGIFSGEEPVNLHGANFKGLRALEEHYKQYICYTGETIRNSSLSTIDPLRRAIN